LLCKGYLLTLERDIYLMYIKNKYEK